MDFDSIYTKYYRELYSFAMKQNQMHSEVTDLLQDVFVAFYKQLKNGCKFENPRAWLYKVLLNSIRTESTIKRSRNEKNIVFCSKIESSTDLSDNYNASEKLKIVESCISQLPDDERNLLLLYHRGFSYREISEILNIGYSSVGTNIARAIKKLKSIIKSQYYELFE